MSRGEGKKERSPFGIRHLLLATVFVATGVWFIQHAIGVRSFDGAILGASFTGGCIGAFAGRFVFGSNRRAAAGILIGAIIGLVVLLILVGPPVE